MLIRTKQIVTAFITLLVLVTNCSKRITESPLSDSTGEIGSLLVRALTRHGYNSEYLPGATVTLAADSLDQYWSIDPPDTLHEISNEKGEAEFVNVVAGFYRLFVTENSLFPYEISVSVKPDTAIIHTAYLKRRPGSLVVTVLDENSQPINGAQVRLKLFVGSGLFMDERYRFDKTTGLNGKVSFLNVSSGNHELHIWFDDIRYFYSTLSLKNDRTNYFEAVLEPGPEVLSSSNDTNLLLELCEAYHNDAARLVLRRLEELGDERYHDVELPADLVGRFYQSIIRVYNARSSARDTVTSMYDIHTRLNPELYRLLIRVDKMTPWVQAWINGQRLTGNPSIDSLMVEYNLRLEKYSERPSGWCSAALRSKRRLNLEALALLFESIDGVIYAGPEYYAGGTRNIHLPRVETGWVLLDFELGWGECTFGDQCSSWRLWRFQVTEEDQVRFVGSWGDSPIPYDP